MKKYQLKDGEIPQEYSILLRDGKGIDIYMSEDFARDVARSISRRSFKRWLRLSGEITESGDIKLRYISVRKKDIIAVIPRE